MSSRLVNSALYAPNVRGTEKLVLVALANFASDETLSCDPSYEEIAKIVGITKQGVSKVMKKLEDCKVISRVQGKGRATNTYHLNLSESTTVDTTNIIESTTVDTNTVESTTVDTTNIESTTVDSGNDGQEEPPLLKENLPPTPPIRENNLSEEEKETPQTPREIQITQVDLWGNPIAEPSSDSSCNDIRATVDCPQDILDMFEEFWEQYPLQENREASIKAFAKLLKPKTDRRAFMDTLMASIELERGSTGWKKGEYLTPVEWLKEVRWCIAKFKEFWTKYPRKVAKGDAFRAFKKLIYNKQDVDWFMRIVMSSLERWSKAPQWTKDNGKFIPYPATWLNRGSWEDSKEQDTSNAGKKVFERKDLDNLSEEEYRKLWFGE